MKGRVFKVFTSSALAVGLLAGCSSGGGAGAGKTLADGDTVTIGLNFELSGGTASYGTAEYNGAKLAIDQYNASDDAKYKIEIAEQDNKGDNAESTTAATRLFLSDLQPAVHPLRHIRYPATMPFRLFHHQLHRLMRQLMIMAKRIHMHSEFVSRILIRVLPWHNMLMIPWASKKRPLSMK